MDGAETALKDMTHLLNIATDYFEQEIIDATHCLREEDQLLKGALRRNKE